MDMQTDKWFAQIAISGVGTPINTKGSLRHISGWIMASLMESRSRPLVDGHEISIIIRDKPFDESKKIQDSIMRETAIIEAGIDSSSANRPPNVGETFEQYFEYLLTLMYPAAADHLARDWFDLPPDQNFLNWMADEKAQRFRRLNSSAKEFESAGLDEYAMLKHYVISTYPEYASNLEFRTAN